MNTIKSIYNEFLKKNTCIKISFAILNISLSKESEAPLVTYPVHKRSQFSANEGDYVFIHLSSGLGFEEIQSLWEEYHKVIFFALGGLMKKTIPATLVKAENSESFYIRAKVNWERVIWDFPTDVTIGFAIGNGHTRFYCDEILVFPANFSAKITKELLNIYKREEKRDEQGNWIEARHFERPFVKSWCESICVYYKCNIRHDKLPKFHPLPTEAELRIYDVCGNLVESSSIKNSSKNRGSQHVFKYYPILTDEGEYTVTISLLGTVMQKDKIVVKIKGDK